MKKILYTFLMVSSSAYAATFQAPVNLTCTDDYQGLQKRIAESKYNETLRWGGYSEDTKSMFVIYTNEESKTWTLIQTDGEFACILGVGDQFKDIKMKKEAL